MLIDNPFPIIKLLSIITTISPPPSLPPSLQVGGDDGKVAFFMNDGDAYIFDFSLTDDDFFKKATKKFYSAASHGRGGGGGSGARAVAVGITAASLLASSYGLPPPFDLPGATAMSFYTEEDDTAEPKKVIGTFAAPFCYDIDGDVRRP